MATLPSRRVAILVFLLLGFCAPAPARQTPAPPAGPRIDLTVGVSREGQLYPFAYAEFYLVAADPMWDVPVKLDRDQAVRLDSSNTMAASRAKDAH
jgi:hypothetical protein